MTFFSSALICCSCVSVCEVKALMAFSCTSLCPVPVLPRKARTTPIAPITVMNIAAADKSELSSGGMTVFLQIGGKFLDGFRYIERRSTALERGVNQRTLQLALALSAFV